MAWLRADRGVERDSITAAASTNGSIVQRWVDYSGTGNNAKGADGQEPRYLLNAVNGKPSIDFGGLDSALFLDDTPDINGLVTGYNARTIFAAFRAGSDVTSQQVVYEEGGGTNGFAIYIEAGNAYVSAWTDAGVWGFRSVGTPIAAGQTMVAVLEFNFPDGERLTGYFNADSVGTQIGLNTVMPSHEGDISIGGSTDSWEFGSGDFFDGEVMEVMIGNISLSKTQRTIVENYLGAKYGANLAPSGRRFFDHSISHGFGVVGIGREGAADFHVKAQSDSVVTIGNAADLGDGEYFFIGNDNGSAAGYTTNDIPGAGLERLGREWRVSETGDVGTLTISIDTAQLGISPSAGFTEYVLFVDTDGVFASGATLVPLTRNGSSWQAAVDLADGDYFTLGVIRPEVQFALPSSNASEAEASPSIGIALNYPLARDLNVTVTETGTGTATEPTDFTFVDGIRTIAAGSTSLDISPDIVNDAEVESDETVIFELTAPSFGTLGANSSHIFNINDDDNFRKANLVRGDSTNTEDQSPVQIGVFLNARNSVSETSIFYSVTGGTASNDSTDYYVQLVDTLVYAIGDTLEFIDINVVDDLIDEEDETIIISLTGGIGATLGDTTVLTYTIQDNDLAPSVQFTTSTRSGAESAQTVDLAVELSGPSGKDITLPFSAVDLTATENADYQMTSSSVTILAGNTTDSIQFIVINDGLTEANEQLRIDLGTPTNASLGGNGAMTYTILDDDGLGFEGLGGVGNLDEQIAAWFKATNPGFGLSNGDFVANWGDNTNNSNDGFQSTGSMQPRFLENVWNGRPVVSFDGNDLIQLNDTDDINTGGPYDQKTIMVAFRTSLDVTTRQMLYEEGGGVRGLSIYIDNGSLYIGGWNNNDDDGGATTPWPSPGPPTNNTVFTTRPIAPNSNNFVFLQFDFLAGTGAIDGDVSASINGENLVTVDGAGRLFAHPGDIGIGGINEGTVVHDSNEGSVQNYNGNMGEVVVQNFVYNPAQFVIVNNYLSSKYNIPLASVPDVFAHDQNPTNYSYELLGIGQVNDSSHIDAQGTGILRLNNPTQLDNDEFMLIGHDNEGIDSWQSTGVPDGDTDNFRILDRHWRVDETGDVGLVTLQLDASSLPSPPVGFTANYVLMVDADGDFSDGATIYGLSNAGAYYGVSNVDITDDAYIAIGLANLVVGFTAASSDGIEDMSPANVAVEANYVVPNTLTVNVATTPNSTAQTADYTLASSVVNIAAGMQSGDVTLNLVNDSDEEPLETVEMVLTGPSAGILSQLDTTLFTIIDDDQARNIQFVLTDSTGSEADSPALIRVFADSLSSVDSLKVYYEVTAGTATATVDYILVADTLKWPRYIDNPNDTIRTISLGVVPDLLDESDETIEITLFSPIQAGFGANRVFTYTIADDDSQPSIDWQVTSTSGLESVTDVHAILQLSAASGQDITLNYSDVSTDPPTPGGIDYDLQGTSLIIPAGTLQDTISFSVFDDGIDGEGNEDVVIQIDGATNAVASVGSTFTYTIIDDDGGFGAEGPGGIGDENQLAFWLRTDAQLFSDLGSTLATNGDDARQWNDQSGNGNHAIEGAANDSLPAFETPIAAANNQDALSFDPSNFEFLTIGNDPLINTAVRYSQKTLAIVFETGPVDPPAANQVIYEQGGGGNGFNVYHGSDGLLHFGAWSTNASPAWGWSEVLPAVDVGANELMMVIFEIDAETGDLRAYINGDPVVSGTTGVNSFLNSHGGLPGIGGVLNDTRFPTGTITGEGNYFEGRIFELVQYNERVLTDPTRRIVQNYFAAKYAINIGAQDIYAHDGTYDREVFGMGVDSDEIHVASSGSGIVRIDNPQTITNGNYLLAGHDGGDASAFTTTNTPPEFSNTFMQRIDRTWRVDETGEFGNVRVSVDLSQLPTFVPGFTDLFLVVGTAADFSTYDTLIRFNETFGSELRTTYNFADNEYFTIALAQNASGQIGPWNDPDTWLIGVPGVDQPALIQDSVYLTSDVTASTIVGLDNAPSDRGKLNLNGFTLTVTDSLLIQGFGAPARDTTTFAANGGTVDYGGAGTDIFIQPLIYHNLTLSGTGRRFLSDKTVILNDIVIDDNPQVITNNHNLDVSGDWISAVNSEFTPGTSTVTFNGSGPQEIRPTNKRIIFNNLVIDKAAGDVSLADSVEVTGVLTLTQNDLVLGGERLIISNSAPGAIVTPGDNTSYIQADGTGVVEWNIVQGNTYTFPIGDASDNYTPLAFAPSALSGTNPTLTVNLTDQRQSAVDAAQSHISRYWSFEPTGVVSATFDITMYYADADVSGDESELVPIKFDVNADTSDFPVFVRDVVNNSITWSGLTSFSDATAGALDDPLPVELIAFEAVAEEDVVVLRWSTATEIDNDRFEVLWSSDAIHFEKIAMLVGAGNTTEVQTYSFIDEEAITGLNYYRLRQVDFDGQSELSGIVSANLKGALPDLEVLVYPNPATADNINLRFRGLKEQPVHILLVDIFGRRVIDEVIDRPSLNYHVRAPQDLKSGMYYLIATHGAEKVELKVIVK
ncbi:MAG: Calx-beta domain-containing protein [Bacteroidota bacterium]